MEKVTITVDGERVEATKGEYLIGVLERMGKFVPTLCNADGLEPYGACRLCIVEQDRGGWSKMVTSCNFPVKDGQVFITDSDKVRRQRNMVMEFILARSSKTPEVIELARKMGMAESRFAKQDEGCILCGMCIRACEEVVGVSAISFRGRGANREVAAPFGEEAVDCIGCGTCAYVCPTRYIEMIEDENTRSIPLWGVTFEMARCKTCGTKIAPKKQLEYFVRKAKLPPDWFDYCNSCRPRK